MNFRGTRPLPSKIACDFRPLPSKIASDFRRQRSVSSDFFGIGGDPPSAVENRLRFSTADEGPFSDIFPTPSEKYQKKDGFSPTPIFFTIPSE